jgi:imidazolonepropionase-like amidohydrolase
MDKLVIKAIELFDGKTKSEGKYITIKDNKIIEITSQEKEYDYSGYVTPAFIDAHSHIGMFRDGEPGVQQEGNDYLDQILPTYDPLNSIYFDDRAFSDAIDFGCLYSCVVPGSGNLMGGRAMIIRNFAKNRKNALIKDYGYKMALGYNPRGTTSWKGHRPNTRMGIYDHLEKTFDEVIQSKAKEDLKKEKAMHDLNVKYADNKITESEYKKQKDFINREYELSFNEKQKAIIELLEQKKIAKIHVHKEDDVLYLIKFVKKYGIKCTADHTGDVHHIEIFDELAKNDIPIIYGPIGGIAEKTELAHAYYQNAGLLYNSKATYGLMTDHPVVWAPHLRESLKYFMIHGMSQTEAINLITRKNAELLGIDDILGTIEINKMASLIVWDKNPFDLAAYPKAVIAEGTVIREKK